MVKLKESMSGYDKDGNSWLGMVGDEVDHFDKETEKRLVESGIAEPVKKSPRKRNESS